MDARRRMRPPAPARARCPRAPPGRTTIIAMITRRRDGEPGADAAERPGRRRSSRRTAPADRAAAPRPPRHRRRRGPWAQPGSPADEPAEYELRRAVTLTRASWNTSTADEYWIAHLAGERLGEPREVGPLRGRRRTGGRPARRAGARRTCSRLGAVGLRSTRASAARPAGPPGSPRAGTARSAATSHPCRPRARRGLHGARPSSPPKAQPTPRTVRISTGSDGSTSTFWRRWRTCTSTLRRSP